MQLPWWSWKAFGSHHLGGFHNLKPLWLQGLDIGPKSIEIFKEALKGSKSVIWNGPMGVFEMKPFAKGTNAIAEALAELTAQVELNAFEKAIDLLSVGG